MTMKEGVNAKLEVLEKLLYDYQFNIRIVKQKDYDGISEKIIDYSQEEELILEICKYDDPKIITSLQRSIFIGRPSETKKTVINKLLEFQTKDEIIKLIKEYFGENTWMTFALTDHKKNSDSALEYLNEL